MSKLNSSMRKHISLGYTPKLILSLLCALMIKGRQASKSVSRQEVWESGGWTMLFCHKIGNLNLVGTCSIRWYYIIMEI